MSKFHVPFIVTFAWLHIKEFAPRIHENLGRFGAYKKLDRIINMKSRKVRLLIAIITLATLGTFGPPLIWWLMTLLKHPTPPLTILTDGDWITVISIIVPAYLGVNIVEKQIALKNGIPITQLDQTVNAIKNNQPIPQQTQDDDADKEAMKDALKHG